MERPKTVESQIEGSSSKSSLDKSLGRWWQGDLVLGNFPYGGYFSDKKWHFNEAFVIFNLLHVLNL